MSNNLLQSLANNELILSILVFMTGSFLLIISDIAIFDTLTIPWHNDSTQVSCIPHEKEKLMNLWETNTSANIKRLLMISRRQANGWRNIWKCHYNNERNYKTIRTGRYTKFRRSWFLLERFTEEVNV